MKESSNTNATLTAEQVEPFFKTLLKVQLREPDNNRQNTTSGILVCISDAAITLEHRDGTKSLILLDAIAKITQLPRRSV